MTLREKVFANLDTAKENACDFISGLYDDEDIAIDLTFVADLEDHSAGELLPHVRAWREREKL